MSIIDFADIQELMEDREKLKMIKKFKFGLTPEEYMDVINFATIMFELEIRYGLGLIELDEEFDRAYLEGEQDLPFFELVEQIYHEHARGCRLCDPTDDMNEEWTDEDVKKICFSCRRRLGKLGKYYGVKGDPHLCLNGLTHR